MANRKAEGSGCGVPGVDGQGLTRFQVCVHLHSLLPEGMVVAIGGVDDCVLVDK